MKKSIQPLFLVFILLPILVIGCVITPSLVPPSPIGTEPSETTLGGKFEFFDVILDQASKDTVNITFGYQIERGLDTSGLQIMAQPQKKDVSCSIKDFTTNSKPYILKGDVPDLVKSDNVTTLSMATPAKCEFKGFTLIVFRFEGENPVIFYEQDFEIPFELEKQ
ncbi:MAG TPA: hypothetical protein VEA58_00270 [Anaerovoracaceae bacterium]|nr:hypothetical protein [Anaerovoracaceae bacterium]